MQFQANLASSYTFCFASALRSANLISSAMTRLARSSSVALSMAAMLAK